MKNLKLLSDDELIELYNLTPQTKKLILNELNRRGIELVGKSFTKRIIKTGKHIELFLKDCGFTYLASKQNMSNPYGSGCCLFVAKIPNNNDFCFQINGEGISEISTINEVVIFSENGIDATTHPLYRYCREYDNFKLFVQAESKRVDFSKGLLKWNFN